MFRTGAARPFGMVLSLVASASLLAGCSHDTTEPDAAAPTSAGPTGSPSQSPDPTAQPRPVVPTEAKANTPAGAEAFARYALSLYGYVFQTGDGTPLSAIAGPSCAFCESTLNDVRAMQGKGNHRVGGEVVVRQVTPVADPPAGTLLFDVLVTASASRELDPAGKVVDEFAAMSTAPLAVAVTWVGDEWKLYDVVSGDDAPS